MLSRPKRPYPRELRERDKKICATYLEGHALEDIGRQFQLSRERIRQIVKDAGIQTARSEEHTSELQSSAFRARFPKEFICQVNGPQSQLA